MLEAAITQFRDLLSEQHVLADEALPERYRWCTTPIRRNIAAVLRPGSVEQVQQIVQIAAAQQVSLYPISTGNNWGYGSAQPVRHHNVVVDLGRMNRIVEVNKELAYSAFAPA